MFNLLTVRECEVKIENSKMSKLWNVKNVELTISLRVIWCSNSVLYAKISEQLITQSIAEFSASVGNDSSWTAIPREYQVQLLSYRGSFLVGYWNHFSPLAEVVLNAENIFVPPTLGHLHEINGDLIPHFLRNWNTFQFCTSFLNTDAFPPLTSVAPLNVVFNIFRNTSPIILSCYNFPCTAHSKMAAGASSIGT